METPFSDTRLVSRELAGKWGGSCKLFPKLMCSEHLPVLSFLSQSNPMVHKRNQMEWVSVL